MPRWSIAKRIAIIVGARIIPAIGFILTYIAFYPGLMSLDSDFQLVQARSFEFSDWHPVIMSLIWSGTNYVLPGPAGLFTLLLGIYWSAFFLVSEYFRNRSLTAYALALALPFLPLLINFSGTLWKDVLVFDCFIFSIGIVLYSCKDGFRHPSTVASIAAVMMIELGILARYNSQFAAVPLVALLFWSTTPVRGAEASAQVKSLLRSALAVAALFVLGTLILDLLLHPKKTYPVGSLFLFDLAGISQHAGVNLLPGEWTAEQRRLILTACFEPKGWDSLWGKCGFVVQKLQSENIWSNLLSPWLHALQTYPIEYFLHRFAYFRSLFLPAVNYHVFIPDPSQEMLNSGFKANLLLSGIKSIVLAGRSAPFIGMLYSIGFWLVAAVLLLSASLYRVMRHGSSSYASFLMSLSAALYIWPLAIVGVASDFRYAYWSICATCLSLVFMVDGYLYSDQHNDQKHGDQKHGDQKPTG